MNTLPSYIGWLFGITTILTVFIFYKATRNSLTTLVVILCWMALQTLIGISGFYTITNTMPPRFFLLLGLPVLLIITLFITKSGLRFIDSLNLKALTMLHVVRIPVELVLFCLFSNSTIPQLMTFEGRNFDILSGLTAPIVYYFGFVKSKLNKAAMLTWNLICLGLLFNIVINAVLSAPFPFQKFAFEQPNIALLYFPFVWLPCCIVPIVLFVHLASIRQLLYEPDSFSAIVRYNQVKR